MLQRDCQGLHVFQTITLLLFHVGISDTVKEVLESIKNDYRALWARAKGPGGVSLMLPAKQKHLSRN